MDRPKGWARSGRAGRRCGRRGGHRRDVGSIVRGSGRRSRAGSPARTLPCRRECRCRWRPVLSGGWRDVNCHPGPVVGRYLSFVEREEIAMLCAGGCGVREIARQLGRCPSTISRELRRNAATSGGGLAYRASTAQWHADRRAQRPKPAKLAVNGRLREYVQDRLSGVVQRPEGTAVAGPEVRWVGSSPTPVAQDPPGR